MSINYVNNCRVESSLQLCSMPAFNNAGTIILTCTEPKKKTMSRNSRNKRRALIRSHFRTAKKRLGSWFTNQMIIHNSFVHNGSCWLSNSIAREIFERHD